MIIFEKVRWKNFLSTGNYFNEVNLNYTKNTLVVGNNGSGKSTILDALSFVLFGKPYRNINKPQLVNTVNNKECLVEVEFNIGPVNYKVVRGMKPTVFQIFKDGRLVNESSHSKEYQNILEQNILKLNYKSFNQIVVLGSSSFVPFMQLTAQQRREVIEDLLDINVFSKMNKILKSKVSEIESEIRDKSYQVSLVKNKIEMQRKYIHDLENLNEKKATQDEIAIKALTKTIEVIRSEADQIKEIINRNYSEIDEERSLAFKIYREDQYKLAQSKEDMRSLVEENNFFQKNDFCPTCTQEINSKIKKQKNLESKEKAKNLKKAYEQIESAVIDSKNKYNKLDTKKEECDELKSQLRSTEARLSQRVNDLTEKKKEIKTASSGLLDLASAHKQLEEDQDEKDALLTEKYELDNDHDYSKAMIEMLKDTGIKTQIIKQYIPVMNNYINKYLQILDFFVYFELSESFQEVIRSRHRDNFSYESFSEGEKQRIDLALLFTWRKIAHRKNSVSTNLLILDETFDSSLDNDGIENLFKIIYSLGESANVFVISHKGEILDNRFSETIEFYKSKNFSRIKI